MEDIIEKAILEWQCPGLVKPINPYLNPQQISRGRPYANWGLEGLNPDTGRSSLKGT